MSAPGAGHCRHCEADCNGGTPIPAWPDPAHHADDDGATWPGGHCPACGEATRVADMLMVHAENLGEAGQPTVGLALALVAEKVRGGDA